LHLETVGGHILLVLDAEELRIVIEALVDSHDMRGEAINQGITDPEFLSDFCTLEKICRALGVEEFEWTSEDLGLENFESGGE